jgi:cytoplasmic iron level regulating protein YaaA (DUF328/UPF0246 family)
MKILISPSKTQKKVVASINKDYLFSHEKTLLLNQLKKMSFNAIKDTFSVSDKLAKDVLGYYETFVEDAKAINTYTGAQFKALDYESLSDEAKDYLEDHLYIMSGLYGLLKPSHAIAYYRLPMGVQLKHKSLESYWKKPINKTLENESFIINLASDEYGHLVEHPSLISIMFYQSMNPLKRALSMEVKKLRGHFLRLMAIHQCESVEAIKALKVLNYSYDEAASDAHHLAFIRK